LKQLSKWLEKQAIGLTDCKREHLLSCLSWRVSQGYNPRSTSRFLSTMRRFYQYCVRESLIAADPPAV